MLLLFKKAPTYADFVIRGDDADSLRVEFRGAGTTPRCDSLTLRMLRVVLDKEIPPRGAFAWHPHDRMLATHALSQLRAREEEMKCQAALAAFTAAAQSRQDRLAAARAYDDLDLPRPPRPRMRHLLQEPPVKYRDYRITGAGDGAQVEFRFVKPFMRPLPRGGVTPVFSDTMTEGGLLHAYRNPGAINHDEHLMIHQALLDLRTHKREMNITPINVRPPMRDELFNYKKQHETKNYQKETRRKPYDFGFAALL